MIEPDVVTERLVLRSMPAAFLMATLAGRAEDGLLGLTVPEAWLDEAALARQRLADLRADAAYGPWSLRAVGLRSTDQMVGHIGFHSRPGPSYLAAIAPAGVELGYTIYPAFRRRGYAREAIVGLMAWARTHHGVPRFVASVGPGNVASNALVASLGFVRVGSHVDDVDGPEDVFLLGPAATDAASPRRTR